QESYRKILTNEMHKSLVLLFLKFKTFVVPQLCQITLRCGFNHFQFNCSPRLPSPSVNHFAQNFIYRLTLSCHKTEIDRSFSMKQYGVCRNNFIIAHQYTVSDFQICQLTRLLLFPVQYSDSYRKIRAVIPFERNMVIGALLHPLSYQNKKHYTTKCINKTCASLC